jgi:hypothetical protein
MPFACVRSASTVKAVATLVHTVRGFTGIGRFSWQVLSSLYMQRQPPSANTTVITRTKRAKPKITASSKHCAMFDVQESAAGTVVEPSPPTDLRSRGLCLVPISCTDHVASGDGHGNGADHWSVAVRAGVTNVKGAAALLPGRAVHLLVGKSGQETGGPHPSQNQK